MIKKVNRKQFNNLVANCFVKGYNLVEENKDFKYYRYLDTELYFLIGKDLLYMVNREDNAFVLYYIHTYTLLLFIKKYSYLLNKNNKKN